jgi:EmrB/QacA subfamily drug resistance transporter
MPAGELRLVQGPAAGRIVAIGESLVLGRDESAGLAIPDEEMSRHHARLEVAGSAVTIEDLGSTNGTFVNDERVNGPRRLHSGDRIKVGATVMEFIAAAAPEPARAPNAPVSPLEPDVTRMRGVPAPPPESDVTRARGIAVQPAAAGELRVVEGATETTALPVAGGRLLGRDPECDLALADEEVSWRHARVGRDNGNVTIEDLGSTNGTYVNGERLLERRPLESGDRIELGSAVLEFLAPTLALTGVRRVAAPQVTNLRQVVMQPSRLLTAETSSRKWWTLLVVCSAVFMLLLDTTIVSVALPSISKGLKASFSELQWVIDAYSMMLAVALLSAGSVSDKIGRRHVFTLGLAVFTTFSAVCGLAPSAVVLDFARGAQGVGGAMMFATSLALLAQEFPPAERGTAFGIWGATTGTAVAIGPLVGGALTQGLGWQAIFYVNVPIGLLAIYLTLTKLANLPGPQSSVDTPGAATFSVALFAFVFALIRGSEEGWSSPLIVGLLAVAAISIVCFVVIEAHRQDPMLDLSLFRKPTFDGASIVAFALSGSAVSLIIYITLWLQSILGFSPLEAGVRILSLTAFALLLSPIAGRLTALVPVRLLLAAGMAMIGGGILLMTGVSATSSWTELLPGLVLTGAGMGVTTAPLASVSVGVVPPWQAGMASGVNSTFRQVGLVVGIAALGALFQTQIKTQLTTALAHTPLAARSAGFAKAIAAGGTPRLIAQTHASQRPVLRHAAAVSVTAGLTEIFIVAGILALIGSVAGAVLVRKSDLWTPPGGGPPPSLHVAAAGG